jgi:hypothetical protein
MKVRTLFVAFLLSLALSHATRATQEITPFAFTPDHYLSYQIMLHQQQTQKVFLRDQFIRGNFYVFSPFRLLNPSDKLHLLPDGTVNKIKIRNPRLHYLAYEINWENPVPVTKQVHIKNQFEESDITLVTYPDRLLAPAAKHQYAWQPPNTDPTLGPDALSEGAKAILLPIPNGSHYLCYPLENLDLSTVLAVFRDQFWSIELNRLTRTHLCNPVVKRHNNKVYETDIHDSENHLVCYDIDPSAIFRKVLTRDQFGTRTGYVYLNDEVCVPTTKTEFVPEIPCGEVGADGECPVATNCPDNTICTPIIDNEPRCVCQ